MKFIKISVCILMVSIIASNVITANADNNNRAATPQVYTYVELTKNKEYTMEERYQKKNYTNQTYRNSSTSTTLTKPCKDCVIQVRAFNSNGGATPGILSKMGDGEHYLEVSNIPGEWYLKFKRYDITLVNTTHGGVWYLDN